MGINNCEQYVLAELDYEQRRNECLVAENNKLAKQLDAMTKRAKSYKETIDRPKTPIEALADEVMREEMRPASPTPTSRTSRACSPVGCSTSTNGATRRCA
ncbi:MAG: hypothetical protein ACLTYW_00265 [Collinsella sp.]